MDVEIPTQSRPQRSPQDEPESHSQLPRVIGVVVSDESELAEIQPALDLLNACMVPHEMLIASTRLAPDELRAWSLGARDRGLQVIIATAGNDAFLPSFIADQTILPIVAIPLIELTTPEGRALDALFHTPDGMPIATTGIRDTRNAAMFAIQVLARNDQRWESSIRKYRSHLRTQFKQKSESARTRLPSPSPYGTLVDPGGDDLEMRVVADSEIEPPIHEGEQRVRSVVPQQPSP